MSTLKRHAPIWWTNAFFFSAGHVAAAYGVYLRPPTTVPKATLIMMVVLWQLASFGITIGYHRLYSHRAFRASFGVRLALSMLGTTAFQGSIKWWCLRHRLHHRFTDDEEHDPYCATRGFLFSHVGWIYFKPTYEKIKVIERDDLERDPVVRFQHRYYLPMALLFGFGLPVVLAWSWGDAAGGFIYGGLVARLLIWHCTFLVNSLAHWDGLQPYSDENTSRGNLILAMLTAGEGNHNFHAFPHDFRSGPADLDFDPSKWIILALNSVGWATGLRRAENDEIMDAKLHMQAKLTADPATPSVEAPWAGPIWSAKELEEYASASSRCAVVIDDFVVDVTEYMKEHPGGAKLLRNYAVPAGGSATAWKEAGWAFHGGLNNHSQAAKRRMVQLTVAKVAFEDASA